MISFISRCFRREQNEVWDSSKVAPEVQESGRPLLKTITFLFLAACGAFVLHRFSGTGSENCLTKGELIPVKYSLPEVEFSGQAMGGNSRTYNQMEKVRVLQRKIAQLQAAKETLEKSINLDFPMDQFAGQAMGGHSATYERQKLLQSTGTPTQVLELLLKES